MEPRDQKTNKWRGGGEGPLITLRKVGKSYATPAGLYPALRDIDLEIGDKEKNNMRLRISMILVALTLFAVTSTASATMSWQPKQPKADAISGAWDAVLINDDNNVQVTLTLKLEGNKVTGNFESSHLGSGAIKNGSWANNNLTIGMETSHAPLTLTGELQNGKLAGEWDAGHMQGKWEAKKK